MTDILCNESKLKSVVDKHSYLKLTKSRLQNQDIHVVVFEAEGPTKVPNS